MGTRRSPPRAARRRGGRIRARWRHAAWVWPPYVEVVVEVVDVLVLELVELLDVLEVVEVDVLEVVASPAGPHPFHAGPHGTAPARPPARSTRRAAARI